MIYNSIIGLPFTVLHVILLLTHCFYSMLSLIWLQIYSWISMESLISGWIDSETVGLLRRPLSGWHLVRKSREWPSSSQALAEAKYLEDSCCYVLRPKQLARLDKLHQGCTSRDLQLGSSHFIKLSYVSGVILGWWKLWSLYLYKELDPYVFSSLISDYCTLSTIMFHLLLNIVSYFNLLS